MKYRGSLDANHEEMKRAFLQLGCTVADLAKAGVPGFPDLVVGCLGRNHLVEVKNTGTAYGRMGLSQKQTTFNRDWNGECTFVVTDADDCVELVGAWRKPQLRERT